MNMTRRLVAGLPAAGVTVFAALAFSGQPVSAAAFDASVSTAVPVIAAAPAEDCDNSSRVKCDGYGGTDNGGSNNGGSNNGGSNNGGSDNGGSSGPGTTPTSSPSTTPGGVSPDSAPGTDDSTRDDALPVTGVPVGTITALGALLAAAGAGAMYLGRRRRA